MTCNGRRETDSGSTAGHSHTTAFTMRLTQCIRSLLWLMRFQVESFLFIGCTDSQFINFIILLIYTVYLPSSSSRKAPKKSNRRSHSIATFNVKAHFLLTFYTR